MTRSVTWFVILACCLSAGAQQPRLIDHGDGTVTDRKTGLMWTRSDTGKDMSYEGAEPYCKTLRAGGHADWRLPTRDELADIFDESSCRVVTCGGQQWAVCVQAPIQLTCPWVWAAADSGPSSMPLLHFSNGEVVFAGSTHAEHMRVLAVRTPKK